MNSNEAANMRQEDLKKHLQDVASQRDQPAFEALFDHFAPLLRAYSLAREPGATLLADELTQEVMIKIWEKAHTYNPELANVNTWVFTLARNCRIDYLRRKGRFVSAIDPTEIYEAVEDENADPFRSAHQQRLETAIQNGLRQLPEEQAQILQKVYLEGKSHQQACDELKLPLGTVKSRIRLALKKLELLIRR